MDDCNKIISLRKDIDKIWLNCKIETSLKGNINSRLDYCTDTAEMIKKRAYTGNDQSFIDARGGKVKLERNLKNLA